MLELGDDHVRSFERRRSCNAQAAWLNIGHYLDARWPRAFGSAVRGPWHQGRARQLSGSTYRIRNDAVLRATGAMQHGNALAIARPVPARATAPVPTPQCSLCRSRRAFAHVARGSVIGRERVGARSGRERWTPFVDLGTTRDGLDAAIDAATAEPGAALAELSEARDRPGRSRRRTRRQYPGGGAPGLVAVPSNM